jgi:hypothetical protein
MPNFFFIRETLDTCNSYLIPRLRAMNLSFRSKPIPLKQAESLSFGILEAAKEFQAGYKNGQPYLITLDK